MWSYPIFSASRAHHPYALLQASARSGAGSDLLMQTRFTSSVRSDGSSKRATGRPTIATPTIVGPDMILQPNFQPGGRPQCAWKSSMNLLA